MSESTVTPKAHKQLQERDQAAGANYIFVTGAPRTGTTLVQNMLDSHPDVLGLPEFKHLPDIIRLRNALQASIREGMIDKVCSPQQVDERIRALIEDFFKSVGDRYPCRWISEKTPQNTLFLEELIELFPAAKFIYVVRDPRAVVASLLKVEQKASAQGRSVGLSVRNAIQSTKKYFQRGFNAQAKWPDKIHVAVYRDLVTYPERETKKICGFLGIEWVQSMLYPGQGDHLSESGMTCRANSIWYDRKMFRRDPQPGEIEKWKARLTPTQQVRITRAFRHDKRLQDLGYRIDLSHLSRSQRLQGFIAASLIEGMHQVRNQLFKLLSS